MRLFITVMLAQCAWVASSLTLDVQRLQEPAYADREVSESVALPTNRTANLRIFRLEMAFTATPSNNVQVAIGRDSMSMDGQLAVDETDLITGWDCGEWFLRPRGLKERYVCEPQGASENGRRTLVIDIHMDAFGQSRALSFAEMGVGTLVFDGLLLAPVPEWVQPSIWTHLRVTVRGADPASEAVRVKFLPDGSVINLK